MVLCLDRAEHSEVGDEHGFDDDQVGDNEQAGDDEGEEGDQHEKSEDEQGHPRKAMQGILEGIDLDFRIVDSGYHKWLGRCYCLMIQSRLSLRSVRGRI